MLPFELLYRDVDSLEVSNLDKEFIKSRLREKYCFDFLSEYLACLTLQFSWTLSIRHSDVFSLRNQTFRFWLQGQVWYHITK